MKTPTEWPHTVKVCFPHHILHGKTLKAARCEQFSQACWDIRGPDGFDYILPLNRAVPIEAGQMTYAKKAFDLTGLIGAATVGDLTVKARG